MSTRPAAPTTIRPITLLIAAVALGVLGDYLFHPGLLGINVFIWTAALCAALVALSRVSSLPLRGEGRWLLLPALLFAGAVAWRSSPVLQAIDVASLIAILAVASFRLREGRIRIGPVTELVWAALLALAHAAAGAALLLYRELPWGQLATSENSRRALPLVRGMTIALPLVVLFTILFAAADAVFSSELQAVLSFNGVSVASHLFGAIVWTWIAAGVLRGSLLQPQELEGVEPPPALRIGPIELTTVLGLLDLLFLSFVAIQVRYFFGGSAHVEVTDGLTYAEYARRGFFELLAVAALVLPVILGVHWLLRDRSASLRIAFRVLAATLILLVFAVIASAFRRMDAYVDEFGLTQLRFYSTAAMVWLVLMFAWLASTLLPERRQRFGFGALASGLTVIAAVNVLNPDAFIVETNAERVGKRDFDTAYALSLSPDATPTLIAALPALSAVDRCDVAEALATRRFDSKGWQTWNFSRERARNAVKEGDGELVAGCPAR